MTADSGKHFDPDVFDVFQAIALPLHQSVKRASGQDVQHRLQKVLGLYFNEVIGTSSWRKLT